MKERQDMTDKPKIISKISLLNDDAPWLVFSNSLVTDFTIFDAQVAAFSNHFNILCYNQRGHGGSDVGCQELNFNILADDLLDLMEQNNIHKCIFIGLSMGVPTGLAAYAKAPDRFSAMVFIDGQTASAAAAADQWQARIDGAKASGMTGFAEGTTPRWLKEDASEQQKETLHKMIAATPFEGFSICASALKSYDYNAVFDSIYCPIQLIAGAQDGGMPATMQALTDRNSHSQFAEVPTAGHVPCFEKPHEVNALFVKFFTQIGAIA